MLIDTHAHVNFNAFKDDAEEVIKRTLNGGVFVINVGSQFSTSKRAVEMAQKYDNGVWAAVGLHPIHLVKRRVYLHTNEAGNLKLSNKANNIGVGVNPDDSELNENDFETTGEVFDYQKYLELAKNPKVLAIGEMGLDYHHFEEGDNVEELKKKQKETFIEGIRMANELQKPMIIHCWEAYDDLLEILKNNPVNKQGVIHSFVGGYKTAGKFIELGYKIGLNGVITYSDNFNRLIKEINLNDIVLETDCPYLAPVPHKGERNEPLYVKLVAEKIAKIKENKSEEVAIFTTDNAEKLFNLKA